MLSAAHVAIHPGGRPFSGAVSQAKHRRSNAKDAVASVAVLCSLKVASARHRLSILDDVVGTLRTAGLFVMLDVHTLRCVRWHLCGRTAYAWHVHVRVRGMCVRGICAVTLACVRSHPEANQPCWCLDCAEGCSEADAQLLMDTWATLADRYCSHPNVTSPRPRERAYNHMCP